MSKNCPLKSGWLDHHEDGVNNGHTIDRHVGKSDAELQNRLTSSVTTKNPNGISSSSSYPNQQVAENSISKAFKEINPATGNTNRKDVKSWAETANAGSKKVISYSGDGINTTGRGISRGDTAVTDKYSAKVVLKSTGNGKYTILTSHPQ
ncbi:RNase A-like domain-containing protein [Acinetobacter lanii]|uniref:RNase A-like domain-containing protein n=1 Tax=Acinetobacter lanii TaxID=2715163 RepID=UPI0018C878F0|nr:RNase A-like domain-containing protein [Acinetobacter lanii]